MARRTIKPPEPPTLYEKQEAAIYDPNRIVWIPAGTKSGKTAGCLHFGYTHSVGRDHQRGLWVEPNYTTARTVGFARVFEMMDAVDPQKTIWTPKIADLEIQFANGSMIRFQGGDKPDSIYGPDYDWAIIDEASRCKETVYAAVLSTLTATNGPLRLIGNVKGRKNWFWQGYAKAKQGLRGHGHATLTSSDAADAGVIQQSAIDDAKRTLPPAIAAELFDAIPTENGANPFGIEAIANCIREGHGEPVVWGADLAKSIDFTVACGLDDTNAVSQLHRWQSDWGQTKDRLSRLIGQTPALIDMTGVGAPIVEELISRLGPHIEGYQFTPKSKQELMGGLANAFQSGEIGIPDGWLREELESFEFVYSPTGGVSYSAPEGFHDDGVCALALAVRHRAMSARRPKFALLQVI